MTQSETTSLINIQQLNYSIGGVAELSLFDNVDQKVTADNVRSFFRNDFPVIRRMAMATTGLQSPINSDMPKGDPVGNSNEDGLVKRVWAKGCLDSIHRALRACDQQSQVIIRKEYLQNEARQQIASGLNLEHSQYHRAQRAAYNQFADAFEVQAYGKDLHFYKKWDF